MPAPELEDLEGSIPNSRSDLLLQIRKELPIMLRKALTLGMVFIFALSLLAVSMITCFTYDAEAHDGLDGEGVHDPGEDHGHFRCVLGNTTKTNLHASIAGWACCWFSQ